jgi:hypothetical protein
MGRAIGLQLNCDSNGDYYYFYGGETVTERWTDETLDRFATTVATAIQANNDANAANGQLTAANAQAIAASNERLSRIERLVESNNRFLESFGQDVKQLTQNMDRLTQQMASTISNSNQDRMDVTTRLSAINRKVDAIALYLGVNQ